MINKKYVYTAKECLNCGGWGSYVETLRTVEEKFMRRAKTYVCKKCNGTGESEQGEKKSPQNIGGDHKRIAVS